MSTTATPSSTGWWPSSDGPPEPPPPATARWRGASPTWSRRPRLGRTRARRRLGGARRRRPPRRPGSPGSSPAARHRAARRPAGRRRPGRRLAAVAPRVQALARRPGRRAVTQPRTGDVPLDEAIDRFYTSDVFMHAWDLARATGQQPAARRRLRRRCSPAWTVDGCSAAPASTARRPGARRRTRRRPAARLHRPRPGLAARLRGGMSTVVLHAVVSVDGYVADQHDDLGHLSDWYFNGDQPLAARNGRPRAGRPPGVSYVGRPREVLVGATGLDGDRPRLFDLINGWEGRPPTGSHVVVVSHRPHPTAGIPRRPTTSSTTWPLRSDRAGSRRRRDRRGRRRRRGRPDARGRPRRRGGDGRRPVVLGTGRPYFGTLDAPHLLEDPHVVIQGDRVLHLRFRVRR